MKLTKIILETNTEDNSYSVILKIEGRYFETTVYSELEQKAIHDKFKNYLDKP